MQQQEASCDPMIAWVCTEATAVSHFMGLLQTQGLTAQEVRREWELKVNAAAPVLAMSQRIDKLLWVQQHEG